MSTREHILGILGRIQVIYRNISWDVDGDMFPRMRLWYVEEDCDTSKPEVQRGRWWPITGDMDDDAIIRTAWLALTVSDEHRRREGFYVDGIRVYGPHLTIRALQNAIIKQQLEQAEEAGHGVVVAI